DPLDDDTLERIAAALAQRVGRPVETRLVVDDSVLGGFVATVGDVVIDASVKRRLDEVGRTLARS
ncbi:MAG: F0F1 ATP synthase subunit delta, partial [Acidimicrobiia bacterium]|nr:F0F1 ATP synthase subunit delta [Acidimicrobiia bacterium]